MKLGSKVFQNLTPNCDIIKLLLIWANVHEWLNNEVYQKCSRRTITSEEERKKKWLPIGSHAHEALKEIVQFNTRAR